jgi:hypothetical protein
MVDENLLQEFFYDGDIPTSLDFAERFLTEAVNDFSWFYIAEREKNLLGFCYINNFIGLSGMAHFSIFREGRKVRDELTQTLIQAVVRPGALSSLYGLTPVPYMHVLRHIKKNGFRILGTLPGACYMASMSKWVPGVISVYDGNNSNSIQKGVDV